MKTGIAPILAFTRRGVKFVLGAALLVVCLAALYFVAAIVGTVWTANGVANTRAGEMKTVYVLSNGFHSDIALPVEDSVVPAGLPVAGSDLPAGLAGTRYLIIGWGSQTAYTSLLALSDLTAEIVFKALLFDRSVMHVAPYAGPMKGEGVYPLELDEDQYRDLIAFMAQTFKTDGSGQSELLAGITQGYGDVFYRANPRFSMFYGCNAWTGEALRRAGVAVGHWTPFAQSIEWNLGKWRGQSLF